MYPAVPDWSVMPTFGDASSVPQNLTVFYRASLGNGFPFRAGRVREKSRNSSDLNAGFYPEKKSMKGILRKD